jgi:uncharacterized protein YeeX (DUF496 family)
MSNQTTTTIHIPIKRALCIGINYLKDPPSRLYGCIPDVVEMSEFIQDALGYSKDNITILRDDIPEFMPTAKRILAEISRMQVLSDSTDEMIIHYSGHGTQIMDKNKDEIDMKDECIVPCDYKESGIITDDVIMSVVSNMRCKTLIIMDCCHSATCVDLPYLYTYDPKSGEIKKDTIQSRVIFPSNVIMLSGCRDSQTSADSYFRDSHSAMGALTHSIINTYRALIQKAEYKMTQIPLDIFYKNVFTRIKDDGFEQDVCLSLSRDMSIDQLDELTFFYNKPITITTTVVQPAEQKPAAPVNIPGGMISIKDHTREVEELKRQIANLDRQVTIYKPYMTKNLELQREIMLVREKYNMQVGQLQVTISELQKTIRTIQETMKKQQEIKPRPSSVTVVRTRQPRNNPSDII